MKVQLSRPGFVDDLRDFLRRAECEVERTGEGTLLVAVPDAYGEEQARLEVDLYLKAWQVTNPDVEAHVLIDAPEVGVESEVPPA